jgi:hypothetical protein
MKKCVHCNGENGDSVKFCEHCGKPMEIAVAAFYCPACKEEIMDPIKFCPHCGAELGNIVPAELRGTWICRGVDSGEAFDTTRILTVNQMQTNFSDGRVWIGIVKKFRAEKNPMASNAEEYPYGWEVTFSVTAVEGKTDIKVGKDVVSGFYLNAAKNAFAYYCNNPKYIFVKQEGEGIVPAELRGTWIRRGVDSGRAFDSTFTITADQRRCNHSDGRGQMEVVKSVKAAKNPSAFKAGEYPSGWRIFCSVTAVEGKTHLEVGKTYFTALYLNAAKNAFTQAGDDFKDIWVKQGG